MTNQRKTLGILGEKLAAEHLENKGYKVIERNYRTRKGEIDIVAEKNNILFFIEVKTRRKSEFLEGYSYQQRLRLREIASSFIAERALDNQVSFAVMGVTGNPESGDFIYDMVEDNIDF